MELNNYLLAGLTPPVTRGGILEEWVQIYNNGGGDLANGAIKVLSYLVDITAAVVPSSSATNPGIVGIPLAPATQATSNTIIVIDNPPEDVPGTPVTRYAGIKSGSVGWAKVKGTVQALVDGTTDVAIGDTLKVANAGTAFIQDVVAAAGVSGIPGILSAAVCLENYTTNSAALKWVHLIGQRCGI